MVSIGREVTTYERDARYCDIYKRDARNRERLDDIYGDK